MERTKYLSAPLEVMTNIPSTKETDGFFDYKIRKFDINPSTDISLKTKLSDVLNNVSLKILFESHCEKEYSSENLKFLSAFEEYKLLSELPEQHSKLEEIYHLFLSEKSPHQVNIHLGKVIAVKKYLENKKLEIKADVLDGIVTDIHELLNDSLSRFRQTEEFKNHIEKLDDDLIETKDSNSDSQFKEFLNLMSNKYGDVNFLIWRPVKELTNPTQVEKKSTSMKSPATVAQEKYKDNKQKGTVTESTVNLLDTKNLDPKTIVDHARKNRNLVRNRNKGFSTIHHCFSGSEFVDFIMEEYIIDSDHARKIAKEIFDENLVVGVSAKTFEDSKKHFYRFAQKQRIFVIGGGYSGLHAANGIDQEYYEVTLISKYEYFENISIIPNFIVHDKKEDYQSLYKTCLKEGVKFIHGEVSSISEKKIELTSGIELTSFDFLIIALGSHYDLKQLNIKDDENTIPVVTGISLDSLSKYNSKITDAKKIAVIGTGPVGVEILGSLVYRYPEKEFHVIGAGDKFMSRAAPKAHEPILKFYKDKSNINLHLGQKVTGISGDIISTDKEEIQVDLAIACTGFKPVSDPIKKGMPDSVNENGYVNVNNSCQVEGYDHIFAIGDITSFKEEKLAISAEMHADVAIQNITKVYTGQKLSTYSPSSMRPMMIYLAPKHTVFCFDKKVMASGYLPSMAKNFVIQKLIKDYKSN